MVIHILSQEKRLRMLEAQQQAEKLLTKEYLQTQHAQVSMNKEAIERRQMLVSTYKLIY